METSADVAAQSNPRPKKRWTRLLSIPAFVIAVPFLIGAALMAMRFGTVLVTRPYAWETVGSNLDILELPGTYVLTKDIDANSKLTREQMKNVRVLLADNHSASVSLLPDMDTWGDLQKCTWSGTGKWDAFDGQVHVDIDHSNHTSKDACLTNSTSYSFAVLKHRRLWMFVGDPDAGTGLIFTRQ